MKDLSDYVVFQDGKFWIDTECEPNIDAYLGVDDAINPPFELNVPFQFTHEGETLIGIVECDDGVGEYAMIPFNAYKQVKF